MAKTKVASPPPAAVNPGDLYDRLHQKESKSIVIPKSNTINIPFTKNLVVSGFDADFEAQEGRDFNFTGGPIDPPIIIAIFFNFDGKVCPLFISDKNDSMITDKPIMTTNPIEAEWMNFSIEHETNYIREEQVDIYHKAFIIDGVEVSFTDVAENILGISLIQNHGEKNEKRQDFFEFDAVDYKLKGKAKLLRVEGSMVPQAVVDKRKKN